MHALALTLLLSQTPDADAEAAVAVALALLRLREVKQDDPFATANQAKKPVKKAPAVAKPRPFSQGAATRATTARTRIVRESSSPSVPAKEPTQRSAQPSKSRKTVPVPSGTRITTDALFARRAGGIERGCGAHG